MDPHSPFLFTIIHPSPNKPSTPPQINLPPQFCNASLPAPPPPPSITYPIIYMTSLPMYGKIETPLHTIMTTISISNFHYSFISCYSFSPPPPPPPPPPPQKNSGHNFLLNFTHLHFNKTPSLSPSFYYPPLPNVQSTFCLPDCV